VGELVDVADDENGIEGIPRKLNADAVARVRLAVPCVCHSFGEGVFHDIESIGDIVELVDALMNMQGLPCSPERLPRLENEEPIDDLLEEIDPQTQQVHLVIDEDRVHDHAVIFAPPDTDRRRMRVGRRDGMAA
jgi:hypothetical protein